MTVRVYEHDGIYTAYRHVMKRRDSGELYESVKRIDIVFPPCDECKWPTWSSLLSEDELEAAIQIFFDKWNFGRGEDTEGRLFQHLCDERELRRSDKEPLPTLTVSPNNPANIKVNVTKPSKPKQGDIYVDVVSAETKVYQGNKWVTMATK